MEQWFCIKPIATVLHAIKLNAGQADTGHAVPGSVARQIQADVHDHNPRIVVPYTTPPHKARSTPTAAQLLIQGMVAFIHTKATGSQPIAEPGSEQNNGHGPYLTYKFVFMRFQWRQQ